MASELTVGGLGVGATPKAKFHVNNGTNKNVWIRDGGDEMQVAALDDIGDSFKPIQLGGEYVQISTGTSNLTDHVTIDSAGGITASGNATLASPAGVQFTDNQMNTAHHTDADANYWINYKGYNGGTTRARTLLIGDGKQVQVASFALGAVGVTGTFSSTGLATFSAGIVSNGNVGINNAGATPSATQSGFEFTSDQLFTSAGASTSSNYQVRFYNGNGLVGSIVTDGSATAFNTSSDYRLKENVTELTGALDRLDSIPVYNFNFKADPTKTVDGFLAHEVSEFVPEAISGEKDGMETVVVTKAIEAVEAVAATLYAEGDELPDGVAVGDEKTPAVEAVEAVAEVTEEQPKYQGIDQSKLVPLMLAAIKELKAKVTALENA